MFFFVVSLILILEIRIPIHNHLDHNHFIYLLGLFGMIDYYLLHFLYLPIFTSYQKFYFNIETF